MFIRIQSLAFVFLSMCLFLTSCMTVEEQRLMAEREKAKNTKPATTELPAALTVAPEAIQEPVVLPLPEKKMGLVLEAVPTDVAKNDAMKIELKPTAAASAAKIALPEIKLSGPEPSVVLGWLKNGNTRFRKGWLRKDGLSQKNISALAKAEKAHATVLTCSDSRVSPELIFDQKLGELNVIRNLGPSLSTEVLASVEYGVKNLGTRLVVVMGHTGCDILTLAQKNKGEKDVGSENMNAVLVDLYQRLEKHPGSNLAISNAKGIASDLAARSYFLKRAIESKQLKIATALYNAETGGVELVVEQ